MKKMKKCIVLFSILCIAFAALATGCDPQKPGGGGLQQGYDAATGQYK